MDINESTYVYVMRCVIFRRIPRESRESPAKDGTARRTKKDSSGRKHEGTGTLRDRWLMNRVLRCFIRSVRRSRFSKLQPLRALAFASADQRRGVHPGAILVKLNAPNQLLARPHNRPWWRVMKHCVPVTITGICVCKRAGNYLRRVARPDGPILLPVTYARKIRPRRDAIYLLRKGDSNNVAYDRSRHIIASYRYFSARRINYIVIRFEKKDLNWRTVNIVSRFEQRLYSEHSQMFSFSFSLINAVLLYKCKEIMNTALFREKEKETNS